MRFYLNSSPWILKWNSPSNYLQLSTFSHRSYKLLKYRVFNHFLKKFGRNCKLAMFCFAPFYARSKVCIAPFLPCAKQSLLIWSAHGWKQCRLCSEGSHADFALHMEWRHSYRDQIIAKFSNFCQFVLTTSILGVYLTNVTTFDHKKYLNFKTKRIVFFFTF